MKTARSQRARKSGSPIFDRSRCLPASLRCPVRIGGAETGSSRVEIVECTGELGEFEVESAFQKSFGTTASPSQSKTRLRAHEERADPGGKCRDRRTPRPM